MRGSIVVALAASVLLAWPAHAQGRPANPSAEAQPVPGPERVVMDAVFWTPPGPVSDTCLDLPAGQLTVTLQFEGRGPTQPVSYRFGPYRYRDPDPAATIALDVTYEPATMDVPLAGGRYCYAIVNRAMVPPGAGIDSSGPVDQAQLVAVKMTVVPR